MVILRCGAVLHPVYDPEIKNTCDDDPVCYGVVANPECENSCDSCCYMRTVLRSISFFNSELIEPEVSHLV